MDHSRFTVPGGRTHFVEQRRLPGTLLWNGRIIVNMPEIMNKQHLVQHEFEGQSQTESLKNFAESVFQ